MAIPAFNGYGMLSDIGSNIAAGNDAANQQAQLLYRQAQSDQLLGQTNQAPQPQSFVQRMLSGLGGAQPPTPAPQRILAPAEASLGATPAPAAPVGNTAPATPAAPTAAALPAKDAYGLYRGMGLPDTGIKAILAGLQGESGTNLDPASHNNSGTEKGGVINPDGSIGVANWNGERQATLLNFSRQAGAAPVDAPTQHKFVAWEMQHNYPDVWRAMNDPNMSAQDKLAYFVTRYLNPKDKQGAIDARSKFLNADYGGGGSAAPISPISPGGAPAAAPVGTPASGMLMDKLKTLDAAGLATVAADTSRPAIAMVAKSMLEQKMKQMGEAKYRQVTDPAERAAAGYPAEDKRPVQQNMNTLEYKAGTEAKTAKETAIHPSLIGEDATGKKVYGYLKADGTVVPVKIPAAEGEKPAVDPSLSGPDVLKAVDPGTASQVKAIVEGRSPYPANFFLKTEKGQQLASLAQQYDPSFEVGNYEARKKTQTDFTTGGNNSPASQITFGNTALGHLGRLNDAVDKLGNADTGIPGNNLYTAARNAINVSRGTASELKSFQATKQNAIDEISKFYLSSGGTQSERDERVKQLSDSASPTELKAVIKEQAADILSKVNSLQGRWRAGMGDNVPDFPIIRGEVAPFLAKLGLPTGQKENAQSIPQRSSALARGQDRAPLPEGVTPAKAVTEAKAAIAAGKDPAWIANKLRSHGIDPSLYGIGGQ